MNIGIKILFKELLLLISVLGGEQKLRELPVTKTNVVSSTS